jgi:AcrR family transcriptional regulator
MPRKERSPARARNTPARTRAGRGSPRPYDSTLRQSQAEQTRRQIVEVAYRTLQSIPLHELSYASLAESLGISVRTIYRHFPDKTDLVQAVASHHIERLRGPAKSLPGDLSGVAGLLRRVHRMLEAEPGTYRLFFHLPVRSQGGVKRLVESVWQDVLSGLPEADRPAAAGLFEIFMGPYAYDVLHENWGLSASQTTRVCLAALDLIASALERDPEALSRSRPKPARFALPGGEA